MISIYDYLDFRKYLHDVYLERRAFNPNVSHRFIEQRIGVSAGYFSRIVQGKKNLSDSLLLKFSEFLKLDKSKSVFFECLVKFCQAKDPAARNLYYSRLLQNGPEASPIALLREQYEFFQEPHHVAVHGLINILKISPATDLSFIGKLLIPPLTSKKIKHSLALLERLKLITLNKAGYYELTGQLLTTGNNPREATLRKFLMDSFANARDAVDAIPEDERASAMMTVSVSQKGFSAIKEKLSAARKEIHSIVKNDQDIERVYQLGMYLIPVTKKITVGGTNG
jgi:uncharacterized protein (TIGR02147 family)